MSDTESLRVVVIEEGDGVLAAQCLEYDICTQAGTIEQLKERLLHQIEVERGLSRKLTGKDFGGIPATPKSYHDLWNRGVEIGKVGMMRLRKAVSRKPALLPSAGPARDRRLPAARSGADLARPRFGVAGLNPIAFPA